MALVSLAADEEWLKLGWTIKALKVVNLLLVVLVNESLYGGDGSVDGLPPEQCGERAC
jgi:hypothetical protein